MPNYDSAEEAHRLAALVVVSALESYVLTDTSTLVLPIIKDEFPDHVELFKELVMAELEDLAHYLAVAYR
jgi:hypothetical protein